MAGVIGSVVVRTFVFLSQFILEFLATFSLPVFFWVILGALIVGGIVYRFEPKSAGEGIPSYINGLRFDKGRLSFSVTFFKFWAALFTLATYGNGGIVGPLGRVSAGILSFIDKKIPSKALDINGERLGAVCGLAAAVGSIFHSSVGAGIFAIEIIKKKELEYQDIFPAILSSSVAVFMCKVIGWSSYYQIKVPDEFMDIKQLGALLLLTITAGLFGGVYIGFYGFISKLFKRDRGQLFFKVIIGSIIASIIGWSINPELLGTSNSIISAVIHHDLSILTGRLNFLPIALIIIIMILTKGICNCITVGSGMSAGFTGPAAIMGMLLGLAFCHMFNIPLGSPTYYAFITAGFCGLLSSSMNIPLSAAIMSIEIFGINYSFAAGLAAVVGFQLTRHRTIYELAVHR